MWGTWDCLLRTGNDVERKVSFRTKVPADAPVYEEAQNGALNFTLTLGTSSDGKGCIMWNGLYDGKGGPFGGNDVPPSDCDNFWEKINDDCQSIKYE